MKSLTSALLLLLLSLPTSAGTSFVINAGEGFDDPTPVEPVGGNPGTTVGEQRLIAFQFAADLWGVILDSKVPVVVDAEFEEKECSADQGVIGSAGASRIFRGTAGSVLPVADTWYPIALANRLAGEDLAPGASDINASFNSKLGEPGCLEGGGWYYGLDNNPPEGKTDFVVVLLHELGHGLGFQSFVDKETGEYFRDFPTIYDHFLFDNELGLVWTQMSDEQRATSATNTDDLVWIGASAVEAAPSFLAPAVALDLTSPGSVAGTYVTGRADFGAPVPDGGIAASIVVARDEANTAGSSTTDACTTITNPLEVAGSIAVVKRGGCRFDTKTQNAQAAGALAIIIVNNEAGPPQGMTGDPNGIEIPVFSLAQDVGDAIISALLDDGGSAALIPDPTDLAGADDFGRPLMYAPSPVELGSSVSHWDVSASPDLLMEPSINSSLGHGVDLARDLFEDIGWLADISVEAFLRAVPGVDSDGDDKIEPGETARIIVSIQNNGDILAVDLELEVDVIGARPVPGSVVTTQGSGSTTTSGVLVSLGDLPVGSEITVTFDIDQLGGASVTLQGLVSGTNINAEPTDDPSTVEDDDATVISLLADSLSATKRDQLIDQNGDGLVDPGERIRYEIVIRNDGAERVEAVRLEDTLDIQQMTLVPGSITTTRGSLGTDAIQADVIVEIGTLEPGESAIVTFEADVRTDLSPSLFAVSNQASVTGAGVVGVLTDDPDSMAPDDPTLTPIREARRRPTRR